MSVRKLALVIAAATALAGMAVSSAKADQYGAFPNPGAPIEFGVSSGGNEWWLDEADLTHPRGTEESSSNYVWTNPLIFTDISDPENPVDYQQMVVAGYLILDEGSQSGVWSDVVVFPFAGNITSDTHPELPDVAFATEAKLYSSVTPIIVGGVEVGFFDFNNVRHDFNYTNFAPGQTGKLHITEEPGVEGSDYTTYVVEGSGANIYHIDSVAEVPLPATATMGLSLFAAVVGWAGVRRWRML